MDSLFNSLLSAVFPSENNDQRRVLIVEDHPALSRIMSLLLRHCQFDTQAVESGDLAYPAALAFRPHFILLDIGLPGLNGYEVAKLIRQDSTLNNVVIIAISAYGPETHPERSRHTGFDHHLTKPVGLDDLLPLLNSYT